MSLFSSRAFTRSHSRVLFKLRSSADSITIVSPRSIVLSANHVWLPHSPSFLWLPHSISRSTASPPQFCPRLSPNIGRHHSIRILVSRFISPTYGAISPCPQNRVSLTRWVGGLLSGHTNLKLDNEAETPLPSLVRA